MKSVRQLADATLFERAGHAGWNLIVWAILTNLAAIILAAAVLKTLPQMVNIVVAVGCALASVGCWMLAVAAKRGNPTAVSIVMAVMVFQLLLSLASLCVALARGGQPDLFWLIISLLVIVALAGSRSVLVELKRR